MCQDLMSKKYIIYSNLALGALKITAKTCGKLQTEALKSVHYNPAMIKPKTEWLVG